MPVFYVRISPETVSFTNVKTGEVLQEPAHLAADGGAVVRPFAHRRALVSDFAAGERLLKTLLTRVAGKSLLRPSPRLVLHPLGNPEGGFTQIELRALHEMGLG